MNAKEKIEELLEASEDGTISAAQVTEAGLHRSVLQEFVKSGEMYRFGRGLYVRSSAWEDDFYLLQRKYGRGIYSHNTALYLLGYSDRTPAKYTMTFPKGYNAPSLKQEKFNCQARCAGRTTSSAELKLNPPPAIRFVFTIWNGRCVTFCAAAAAIFKSSVKP